MTNKEIKKLCRSFGADLVGVASVERFVKAPKGYHPTDVMPTAKSVISLGMVLPKDILEQDIRTYTDIRNEAVKKMDQVAADVAAELKEFKHKAVSIVSLSGKFVDGHFRSRVSLKHAAELAGLGVIARNYLLTNDKYGNLLWFTAVITSLELEPDPLATYQVCNNCNLCVDLCPSGALADENNFSQKPPRPTAEDWSAPTTSGPERTTTRWLIQCSKTTRTHPKASKRTAVWRTTSS